MTGVLTVLARKLWIQEPLIPGASCGGMGFPKYGLPVYPPVPLDVFQGMLPPLMFELLATAWVIVFTRHLSSKKLS